MLDTFFASVSTSKIVPQESQTQEIRKRVCRKEDLSLVNENLVRDHLGNLNGHKPMGPDEVHPQVLRELAEATVKLLSVVFERERERSLKTGG